MRGVFPLKHWTWIQSQLKPDQAMMPEEIIDWCKGRLATFKVPRFVQFREDLPKTATQRTAKHVLKEEEDVVKKAHDMETYKKSLGL